MKSGPRYVTLTLHPAIDRVVKIDAMVPGGTFDGREQLTVPAGKGVNTARVLRTLCGLEQKVIAAVWAGENEARYFKTKLRDLSDIQCAVCPRPVATRFAQTYLAGDGTETHIKESMPPPSPRESGAFLDFWRKTVREGDTVAVCGSAPPGTKPSFLKSVFRIAHERGAGQIIADTNGPALRAAAASKIALLKGNAKELGELLKLDGAFQASDAAHQQKILSFLREKNAPQRVLITLGAEGALLVSDGRLRFGKFDAKQVGLRTVSTTGCGDAATAGALRGLRSSKGNDVLALLFAVASGAAKTLSEDPGRISLKSFTSIVRYCSVTSLLSP